MKGWKERREGDKEGWTEGGIKRGRERRGKEGKRGKTNRQTYKQASQNIHKTHVKQRSSC